MTAFELKQRAYRSTLKSRALNVLLYLIDRTNKEMTCFPAISTIAEQLHISVSTVKRALKELEQAGFLRRDPRWRDNGGQSSNLYTLDAPAETLDLTPAPAREEACPDPEDTRPEYAPTCVAAPAAAQPCGTGMPACCPPVHIGRLCMEQQSREGAQLSLFGGPFFFPTLWTGEGVILRPP